MRSRHVKRAALILFILQAGLALSQPSGFEGLMVEFEDHMNQAAKSWLNKNYGRALDWLASAKELVREGMPPPTDSFSWKGCRALITYSTVMSRLVEYDMHRSEEDTTLSRRAEEQAAEWAGSLKELARDWAGVKDVSEQQAVLRARWFKRFSSVIRRVEQMSQT